MKLLGSGVQGDQTDQTVVVHYADGSKDTANQSFSDWPASGGCANGSLGIATAYRDNNDDTQDAQTFPEYLYALKVNPLRLMMSITVPKNRNVVFLSMTLEAPSLVDLEPLLCPIIDPNGKK